MKKEMNIKIAEIFYEIADLMELKNDKWRAIAYRAAAQSLESLKQDVQDVYLKNGEAGIEDIPNVGEALAKKIIQYINEEKIDKLEELKKDIPHGIYEMMQIPGVGAKKAKLFYDSGIKNINQLKKSAEQNELLKLPGFKKRSEEKILEGIAIMGIEERIPLKEGEKIANNILNQLNNIKEIKKAEIAGSIRRKKSTIRDFDFVVLTDKPEIAGNKIVKMDFVRKLLGRGKEKVTIIIKQGRQVDFRFFNKDEYGAGLLYFTGDKNYNIYLRKIAIKKAMKLNEYGLFKNNKKIAGKNEKEIFEKLGLTYLPPKERVG